MEEKDGRLDPIQRFTLSSLRLDLEKWRDFVSEEENLVIFNSFFNAQNYCNLFICRDSESGLSVSLNFPKNVQTKVICVSKTSREVITTENIRKILTIQEVQGQDAMSFIIALCDEVRQLTGLTVRFGYFKLTLTPSLKLSLTARLKDNIKTNRVS